ncbi:salivary peroxidase/catechol oxidase-like [Babylonia areolata]|uniref:salivary peroxidase/catechol oxidase-like n=1 Tax=Babylonia areolata TaxID=304850 RepID=UPI003FD2D90D
MNIVLTSVVCLLLLVSFGNIDVLARRGHRRRRPGSSTIHSAFRRLRGPARARWDRREDTGTALNVTTLGDGSPSVVETVGGSSLIVDASCTGSIHYKPSPIHRSTSKEDCHTDWARRYRTADGSCNSVFNLGAADTPFNRLLPALYADYVNSPRSRGSEGYPLPTPTDVSRLVLSSGNASMDRTTMFVQWGQFIDHDLTLTPVATETSGAIHCCGPNGSLPSRVAHPDCFPIKLSKLDADKRFVGHCMEFIRSLPARRPNGHEKTPREQINTLTAFLDGSVIYGSSLEEQRQLRTVTPSGAPGDELKTSENNLLPKAHESNCIHEKGQHCFLAGDARVHVQPALTVVHTMFVRLHNEVVVGLRKARPEDGPEELFQLARKVVVAIIQKIHYKEWLPLILGPTLSGRYGLWTDINKRCGYSSSVDPRILNSFATAAFRFGHSLLNGHLMVDGKAYKFRELFFKTDLVFKKFYGLVISLVSTGERSRSQSFDRHMKEDFTDHLFEPQSQAEEGPSHGLDLGALNIQRGRDHGLPPYNHFRKVCGFPAIRNFSEFGEMNMKLQHLYRSVDNIDLFVGGLMERPVNGGTVGPTFACIIAQQFHALKYGDRFYFETDRIPEGFTDDQLQAILNVTLSKVFCVTTGLDMVQKQVFLPWGDRLNCTTIKEHFLDYSLWKN